MADGNYEYAVRIIKELHQQNPALYDHFGTFRSSFMGMVAPDGSLDLYHGVLRAKDADGARRNLKRLDRELELFDREMQKVLQE